MKAVLLSIAAFLIVHLTGAYLLWLGGFNFDDRNPWIAYVGLVCLMFAVFAAAFVYSETENDK